MMRCSGAPHAFVGRRIRQAMAFGAFSLLAVSSLFAQQAMQRGFGVSADVTMRIYAPAGTLRLRVWERDSIHVAGSVGAGAAMFGGGSRTHVKFGVEPKTAGDATLPTVDWTVTVPRRARVWIKMIDGSMLVEGTAGEVELYNVRGQIVLKNVSGVTSVESIDAPVSVTMARGDIRVRGGRGAVTLDEVRGTLSLATVSGPVTLSNLVASGRVETIGGAITFIGGSLAKEALEFQTHSGNIELRLDGAGVPRLELSSRAGPVLGDKLIGQDAHGLIDARSFKGRITLKKITNTQRAR